MLKAAVIGSPIQHSVSPSIHNYWLKKYNIDGEYEKIHVKEDELEDFLANKGLFIGKGLSSYSGINITVPHKITTYESTKDRRKFTGWQADALEALNTVTVDNDKNISGYNTDVEGFTCCLERIDRERLSEIKNILILGAGGATRAVLASIFFKFWSVASEEGNSGKNNMPKMTIANRSRSNAESVKSKFAKFLFNNVDTLVEELTDRDIEMVGKKENSISDAHRQRLEEYKRNYDKQVEIIDWSHVDNQVNKTDLLINTTSLGMKGKPPLKINFEEIKRTCVVIDIVFNPLETELLKEVKKERLSNYRWFIYADRASSTSISKIF